MKVADIEGITEYALANGTRVLLFPDPSKNVVTVNMTVFVGSRHEGYGEAGMAHLLEHMLFKGTPTHSDVPKALQERGARFNGTTWVDRTNYYETLPASEANLEFAIRLEADRLVNSFVRGEDLVSEMTVVRNEFEHGENDPFSVLLQRMTAAAFEWHNYGKTTIGNRSDIERVPIARLRQFYKKFYRPDNVLVIVAGKFDPVTALGMLENHFGRLPVPNEPIDNTYTTEPPQDGERTVVLRRVGSTQLVGVLYHIPSGRHPDFAAARLLTYILGDEPSGRLYKKMVEPGLASSVFAFARAYHDPGMLLAAAQVPNGQAIEVAQQTLIATVEAELSTNPITLEELERARQQILKQREMAANSTDNIAVSLSDWAAQGDWRLYFRFRDVIESLTVEEVQQAANRYLVRNNRTIGLYIPSEKSERVIIPESPNLNELFTNYEGRANVAAGEAFDPTPINIESLTQRGILVDGIKFAYLPKRTRGESVSLMLTLRYGNPVSLQGKGAAIEFLPALMSRGTVRLTYSQLQDELTRLRAELQVSGQPGLLQFYVKTKRDKLPDVLDLIHDIVRLPRWEAAELEVMRRQAVTGIEQALKDPQALAGLNTRRELAPYSSEDIRYLPTLTEELDRVKRVTIEQVIALHQEFLSCQAGELAVVGDFDPNLVSERMSRMLAGWTSAHPYGRITRPAVIPPTGSLHLIETPDKANAVFYASQHLRIADAHPDFVKLILGNYVLGGGALSSRLGVRVRQQEGLSYSVGSVLNGSAQDERTEMSYYAIANPASKDQLLQVIREVVTNYRDGGMTTEELSRAKEGYLQQQSVARTEDRRLASLLVSTLFNNRTMQFYADQEMAIDAATLDEVNHAIGQYIDPTKLVISIAGDFAAAVTK